MRALLALTSLAVCTGSVLAQTSAPFINQKKFVLSGQEWNREVVAHAPGAARCKVAGPGALAITVIADRGYQAMRLNEKNRFMREDVLLTVDSPNAFDEEIRFPTAGNYWFIIQNSASHAGEITLTCAAVPKS